MAYHGEYLEFKKKGLRSAKRAAKELAEVRKSLHARPTLSHQEVADTCFAIVEEFYTISEVEFWGVELADPAWRARLGDSLRDLRTSHWEGSTSEIEDVRHDCRTFLRLFDHDRLNDIGKTPYESRVLVFCGHLGTFGGSFATRN